MEKENLRFYTLSSKELNNKSGIYKFSAGGHIYIGSSKNLYARLAEHRADLKEIAVYVKPEDSAIYYVINGKATGKVEF